MVQLGQPNECDCKTCVGAVPVPPGYYGGFLCTCSCHDAQRAKDKAERGLREASQKMCPFCHTNFDYQTRCCAKLALVYDELVVLRNYYGKQGLESRKLDIENIIMRIGK